MKMSKNRSTLQFLALIGLALLLGGCAKLIGPIVGVKNKPTPVAPNDPLVSPTQVQTFELKGAQRMSSNTILMWRQNEHGIELGGQVAKASSLADTISKANDLAEGLNTESRALKVECGEPCDEVMGAMEYFTYLEQLTSSEEHIKGLAYYNSKIRQKKRELRAQGLDTGRASALSAEVSTLSAGRDTVEASIRSNESYKTIFPNMPRLIDVDLRLASNSAVSMLAIDEIVEVVDYYQRPPSSIVIRDGANGVEIEIQEWATLHSQTSVATGEGNFSTRDGSIEGVSYQPFGGRLKFTVRPPKETVLYSFELTRGNYAKTATDGRIYYSGDIYKKSLDGKILRRGTVKLSGRTL